MRFWGNGALKALLMPGGILLGAAALVLHTGWLTLSVPALSFLGYSALVGGMLLAWRFHSSRTFLALLALFLARETIALIVPGLAMLALPHALQAVAVLVPLDFVLIAFMQERGFTVGGMAPIGLLLFIESLIVAVLERTEVTRGSAHPRHPPSPVPIPESVLIAFLVAGAFLLVRSLWTRKLADSALLWSLTSFFLSLRFLASARITTAYSATAACILAVAIIENSYMLAYHDELTGLLSRRSFNDALERLQAPYSIAMVDIDHFKRFNDTFGHDTGDQVLRLVATKLARVSGGGEAYRCGGEEFAILFPGKTTKEVMPNLEELRLAVEAAEFRARGGDRRRVARGPERRNEHPRRRSGKGHAIRQMALQQPKSALAVTVSIGVAGSGEERAKAELVLQAADKALYRAKETGRNRVEAAGAARRPTSAKAAGIA